MDPTAVVSVKRLPSSMNKRVFEIFIDDNRKMGVYNDETVNIDVEAGKHTIEVKGFGKSSGKVPFSVEHENTVNFECGYNGKQAMVFIFVFTFSILIGGLLFSHFAPDNLRSYTRYLCAGLGLIIYLLADRPGRFVFVSPAK
jgi:hypothetical protein